MDMAPVFKLMNHLGILQEEQVRIVQHFIDTEEKSVMAEEQSLGTLRSYRVGKLLRDLEQELDPLNLSAEMKQQLMMGLAERALQVVLLQYYGVPFTGSDV